MTPQTLPEHLVAEFAADVARDLALTPKQLQSKYLYDPLGSSLFEAICRLPWYRITRAECDLLTRRGGAIVKALRQANTTAGDTARDSMVVELGCGSGEKLTLLAEVLRDQGASASVHLVDVSAQALEQTEERLKRRRFPVVSHQATYEDGLRAAVSMRPRGAPVLVLFLGSNIGNFDRPAADEFLERIAARLSPGDLLLLGADLVKPAQDLLIAYDDPLGVTAAFNRNLLVRINNELDGNFELDAFDHRAVWNPREQRIEMHLVSRIAQEVQVRAADVTARFEAGEHIWTESSYKYEPEQIVDMSAAAGFALREQWIDAKARFALTLFERR